MKNNLLKMLSLTLVTSMLLIGCGHDHEEEVVDNTPAIENQQEDTSINSEDVADEQQLEDENGAEFQAVTIVDQGGKEVTIETEPVNVAMAGLPPFTSFFVQFTGSTEKIACMPGNSLTYPTWIDRVFPEYANIPTVGMGPNYSVEEVLAMEPDLIICTTGMEESYQAFQETGIPTIGLNSSFYGNDNIANANSWIEILGQIFNEEEKANSIIENNNRVQQLVSAQAGDMELSGLMLPDYSENIIEVSNDDYYGGYWLASAGISNVAKDVVGWESTMEEVLVFNPDVIYLSAFSAYQPSDLYNDTAVDGHIWSATTAGENQQIYKFPVGLFNWYALSPDAAMSMLWIASNGYPENFVDIDMNTEIKAHYALFGIDLTDDEVINLLEQN